MTHHHALLCVGSHEECFARIPLPERSGADAEVIAVEQFEIVHARSLRERAWTRPVAGARRRFIISCHRMTRAAQNALLKLFEDPPETAQFYLIVPREEALLPTLHSRLQLFCRADARAPMPDAQTQAFFADSVRERLALVARLVKAKDAEAMRALIRGIEYASSARTKEETDATYLADALLCSRYSEMSGASRKMLLEHLALTLVDTKTHT